MNVSAWRGLALAGLLILTASLQAGQTCEEVAPAPERARTAFRLSLATREALDASGAELAIIARAGQDLSRWKLRYSHAGLIWRDSPQGRWRVVHLLNDCGTAKSGLWVEGLANFFLAGVNRWEALLIIPPPPAQRQLVTLLTGPLPGRLHEPHYNMVAYPFATRYQNSNQWLLEVLGAALATPPATSRAAIQQWLQGSGYHPSTLAIPAMTRLGGRLFRANVAFDDHPNDRRLAGQIDVVSVESVRDFLLARGAKQMRVAEGPGGRFKTMP